MDKSEAAQTERTYRAGPPEHGGRAGGVRPLYSTQPVGPLFEEEKRYNAWCPSALHYDRRLGRFIMLLYSCDAHAHTASYPYFTLIHPDTLEAEKPRPLVFRRTDGQIVDSCGLCPFILLPSGEYMLITRLDRAGAALLGYSVPAGLDAINCRVVSRDCGESWQYAGPVHLEGLEGRVDLWGIYRGNSGRLLAGYDTPHAGIAYSDDEGRSWRHVEIAVEEGLRANEPCIVQLEGNRLMALLRRTLSGESGEETALLAFSDDNGESWTAARSSRRIRMNASNCGAVVHDGVVEIFSLSRFPAGSLPRERTGKAGEIRHYAAAVEDARRDRFSDRGVVVSSIATDPWGSGDFSTPCCAVDDRGRLLIAYFDASRPGAVAYRESRHYFVRGVLTEPPSPAPAESCHAAKSGAE